MKTAFYQLLCSAFALLSVVGCSSGGDDGDTPTPTPQPEAATLTVTPLSLDFETKAGEAMVTIATTAPSWKLNFPGDVSWAKVTITTGLKGESQTKVIVEENTKEPRSATFTVTAPNCSDVAVKISQKGVTEEDFYGGALTMPADNSNMGDLSSQAFARSLGVAWNLGNTLEATGGETAWGNPYTTREMINCVKKLGFTTIRIPVSWLMHGDGKYGDYHIAKEWLDRVETVVNYALDAGLYVMINEHYDSGAFNDLSAAKREAQLKKAEVMWRQIAIRFRDYDRRLIFAGFNENYHEADATLNGSAETLESQNLLLERFVKTVRETGGRNAYRYLAVQAYETNIPSRLQHLRLPEDSVKRLLVECHCYTPYAFTIAPAYENWMGNEEFLYLWDTYLTDQTNSFYMEAEVRAEIKKFGDWCKEKQVGALLGEFGTTDRYDLAKAAGKLQQHYEARAWWSYVVADECAKHGICPMLWDNGDAKNNGGGVIDRHNLKAAFPSVVNAIMDGFAQKEFSYRE